MNKEAVPREAIVAAIFCAITPDLPTPLKITLPELDVTEEAHSFTT